MIIKTIKFIDYLYSLQTVQSTSSNDPEQQMQQTPSASEGAFLQHITWSSKHKHFVKSLNPQQSGQSQ